MMGDELAWRIADSCIFMSICIYALIAALCLALVFFEATQGTALWAA